MSDFPSNFSTHLNPINPIGHVVFCYLNQGEFYGKGKCNNEYINLFCKILRSRNICVYAAYQTNINEFCQNKNNVIIINIYNEDMNRESFEHEVDIKENNIAAVWNQYETGRIISSKRKCNKYLSEHGISVPRSVEQPYSNVLSFSINDVGHTSEILTFDSKYIDDHSKFSTEFIDSGTEFEGQKYYVSTRILAVGKIIVGGMVRARPADQGLSVHLMNTPKNHRLLNFLYHKYYKGYEYVFSEISSHIFNCLGFGFYAHDLIPRASTGEYFVCETGFKFHSMAGSYYGKLEKYLPELSLFFNGEFERRSALAFLEESVRHGCLPAEAVAPSERAQFER